ncbi:hypothetical protein [Aliivibrio kagoshimensis]|uniref:hypothetical protein n=1 Tax=Aliivibrio kagoshimensis TaxID=2910230 RepID=UPI003D126DB5
MALWFAKIIDTTTEINRFFGPFDSIEEAQKELKNQFEYSGCSFTPIYSAFDKDRARTMASNYADEAEEKLSEKEIAQTERQAYKQGALNGKGLHKNPYRPGTQRYEDYRLGWQRN